MGDVVAIACVLQIVLEYGILVHALYVSSVHVSDQHQNKYKYMILACMPALQPERDIWVLYKDQSSRNRRGPGSD